MKKHRILVSLTLALVLLCGTALAANTVQQMQIRYMDIKLVVDGVEVTPTDATGRVVEPFVSDGTTYLPVRAVANTLGKDVEWDGNTNTVYIGNNIPGKSTNWMTEVPPYNLLHATAYDGSNPKSTFSAGGVAQTRGVVMECGGGYNDWDDSLQAYVLDESSSRTYNGSVSWNPNGQYQTMHITVEHMGDRELNCHLDIYVDEVFSQTVELPYDGPSKKLDIPLDGATGVTLKLVTDRKSKSRSSGSPAIYFQSQYALYDISFSK